MASPSLCAHIEYSYSKDNQGTKVLKVLRVMKVLKGLKVLRVLKFLKVLNVLKVLKVLQGAIAIAVVFPFLHFFGYNNDRDLLSFLFNQ